MEAASAPKLSSSSATSASAACPLKEVSRDMAALLDFAEYQDDVIQYLRAVDTKHTPKYQVRKCSLFSTTGFLSSSSGSLVEPSQVFNLAVAYCASISLVTF